MLPKGESAKTDNVDKQEYTGVSRLDCFFFILHYTRAKDSPFKNIVKAKKRFSLK